MIRLLAILAILQSSVALAQSDRDAEARGIYLAGQAAYDDGRYDVAYERFEEAQSLSGRPELLFNMGHAAQLDGQLENAIEAFERYMEEAPRGENREGLEERVEILRRRLAEEEAIDQVFGEETNAPQEAIAEEAEPEDDDEPSHALALTLGIGGAAIAAGGGVMFGLMASQQSTVRNSEEGSSWADVEGNHSRAKTFRTLGISLAAAGVVLAGVGLSLWLGRRTRVDVHAQGLRVSGSF